MSLSKPSLSNLPFSKSHQEEDRRLWQSLRKGNELGFSSLYKKYVNALFNYGMHIWSDREETKEVIQEVFSKLWMNRENLREVDQVNFYIFSCFRNALYKRLKERGKLTFSEKLEDKELIEQGSEAYWISQENTQEIQSSLQEAIDFLSPRQKEVIILRFYQGLSHDHLAQIMGISKEGVYNLLSKALHVLKTKLKK